MSSLGSLADDLCRELSSFDPALHSVVECARLAERFARAAKACSAASARAASRASTHGRPADYLAHLSGSSPSAARDALRAVESVEPGSETEHALASGEISMAQAAAIASAPGHEAELLALARSGDLGPVRRAARKYRLAAMPVDELRDKQHAARGVRRWENGLGNVCLSVEMPPEVGVPWVNRFDREVDREWRKAQREGRPESRQALAADVFVRMTSGTQRDVKADIVLVCDINAYRRGHAHDGEVCHIIGGGPIPVDLVQEMMHDAFLKVVLHDGVNVQMVKHFGRRRSAELQTALDLGAAPRFEGAECVREGCGRRYHLQWDHKDPVANGGPTCLENLQGLCPPDHTAKTERDRKAGKLRRKERGP